MENLNEHVGMGTYYNIFWNYCGIIMIGIILSILIITSVIKIPFENRNPINSIWSEQKKWTHLIKYSTNDLWAISELMFLGHTYAYVCVWTQMIRIHLRKKKTCKTLQIWKTKIGRKKMAKLAACWTE